MTNFDKIKQEISKMTLEEFSKHFHKYLCNKIPGEHCAKYPPTVTGPSQCEKCIIDWLKSEAE